MRVLFQPKLDNRQTCPKVYFDLHGTNPLMTAEVSSVKILPGIPMQNKRNEVLGGRNDAELCVTEEPYWHVPLANSKNNVLELILTNENDKIYVVFEDYAGLGKNPYGTNAMDKTAELAMLDISSDGYLNLYKNENYPKVSVFINPTYNHIQEYKRVFRLEYCKTDAYTAYGNDSEHFNIPAYKLVEDGTAISVDKNHPSLPLPDISITQEEMFRSGYKFKDMLPVSVSTAKVLMEEGIHVSALYSDGTEIQIPEDHPVNLDYGKTGACFLGVTKDDWSRYVWERYYSFDPSKFYDEGKIKKEKEAELEEPEL
jgi:hypothetical protein